MKKPGIIVREAFDFLNEGDFESCSRIYCELYCYTVLKERYGTGGNPEFIPMISGYLGAKTRNIKTEEIEYAALHGSEGVLYYFDAKNVKFGDFELLDRELSAAKVFLSKEKSELYLPYDYFEDHEIDKILSSVRDFPCRIMLFFDEGVFIPEKFGGIISKFSAAVGKNRISCAFADRGMYAVASASLEKEGIENGAYYA